MGRKVSVIRYAVAAAAIAVLCGGAAQGAPLKIDPRCAKFRDKLGCTCALLNGGRIYTKGAHTGWASARGTSSGRPTNQAFTQCIIDHGGPVTVAQPCGQARNAESTCAPLQT